MHFLIKYIGFIGASLLLSFSVYGQEKLSLQAALKLAKSNNRTLQSERYEVNFAEAEVETAKLRLNPTLENESIQMMQKSEFADNTNWHNGQNREIFWQLSKPFQWAGQRKNAISFANKNLQYSEEEYAEVERDLFLNVAEKWIEVWTTQKQLEIIQEAKSNIDSLTQINQRRFQNQVITETELHRTEVLAKQYAIQLKTASQEVKNQHKELGFLLGFEEEIVVDTASKMTLEITPELEQLIEESLANRSDIRSAKQLIEVTESNRKLQKSLAVPQPEVGVIFNPMGAIPYMGLSFAIDIPFFDRNQGERKKALQWKEQAEFKLQTVQKRMENEVAIALSNYQLQQSNVEDFEALLLQSEQILENVKQTYLMGGTTIIDFLEAQRSWLEMQQQHYEAQQAFIESHITLLYATGKIHQLAED